MSDAVQKVVDKMDGTLVVNDGGLEVVLKVFHTGTLDGLGFHRRGVDLCLGTFESNSSDPQQMDLTGDPPLLNTKCYKYNGTLHDESTLCQAWKVQWGSPTKSIIITKFECSIDAFVNAVARRMREKQGSIEDDCCNERSDDSRDGENEYEAEDAEEEGQGVEGDALVPPGFVANLMEALHKGKPLPASDQEPSLGGGGKISKRVIPVPVSMPSEPQKRAAQEHLFPQPHPKPRNDEGRMRAPLHGEGGSVMPADTTARRMAGSSSEALPQTETLQSMLRGLREAIQDARTRLDDADVSIKKIVTFFGI